LLVSRAVARASAVVVVSAAMVRSPVSTTRPGIATKASVLSATKLTATLAERPKPYCGAVVCWFIAEPVLVFAAVLSLGFCLVEVESAGLPGSAPAAPSEISSEVAVAVTVRLRAVTPLAAGVSGA